MRRLYRALLLLLPPAFRREFGADMEALFAERLADSSGFARRTGIGLLAGFDVLRCLPFEWARAVGLMPSNRRSASSAEGVLRDARLAARSLLHAPGFTALAVLTLALGIGAAVAMFTVVNATLLRPLPYPEPDRLVRLSPGQNFNIAMGDAVSDVPALVAHTGIAGWGMTLTSDDTHPAEQVSAQAVDAGFFDVFGVRPVLGRGFRAEERDPARSDVVVLSDRLWRRRFGADPTIVGRRIPLGGYIHDTAEVVGVMPRDFEPWGQNAASVDAWIPLSRGSPRTVATDSTWYVNDIIGRMAPDATVDRVASQVRVRTNGVVAEFSAILDQATRERAGASGLLDSMVGEVRSTLLLMLAAVGLVVTLACANLANLMLVRGQRRRRELAIRAALGADRRQLVREQLIESLVLAGAGGAIGVVFAHLLVVGMRVGDTAGLPRPGTMALDARVLAFGVLLSLVVAVGFGLWPALRSTRAELRGALSSAMRSRGPQARSYGSTLVAVETALATVLVIGTGLLLASVRALRSVDPGIDAHNVVAMEVSGPGGGYTHARGRAFYDALLERLAALPGVRAAGAIHLTPVTQRNWSFPYLAEGMTPPDGPLPKANFRVVSPTYFETVHQPRLRGRALTAADQAEEAAPVGLINLALANRLWPGEDPIGRWIKLFGNQQFTVVGVVGDVRQAALDAAPEPEMYLPYARAWALAAMTVVVESDRDPGEMAAVVRAEANALDPDMPVIGVRPLAEVLDESMAQRRFFANALTFFGLLALGLGALGVYSVVSTMMSARRTEYGVRIALGASRGRVLGSALAAGLGPVAAGLVVGIVGAAWSSRLLTALLFGIRPRDPATFFVAALVLALAAAAAITLPALRVARMDAARVLRGE